VSHSCAAQLCYEHRLQWTVLRQRFKRQMIDVWEVEELRDLHNLTVAAMLPRSPGEIQLDDRPQATIDKAGAL
jgi:hypothetical protein